MTELETKVDQEIGLDTEAHRVQFLKYVNYGKQLQLESPGSPVSGRVILDEVAAIIKAGADASRAIEHLDEDEAFESLQVKYASQEFAEIIKEFQSILDTVDQKHGAVIADRNAKIEALRAKYP